jgi:predicted HicB family RNase H-like nuclease
MMEFQGQRVKELKGAFRESVDDYLAFCDERSESPDKPFSGQFVTRIPPELHRRLNATAVISGQSLNAWVTDQLEAVVQRLGLTRPPKGNKPARARSVKKTR